MRLEHGCVSVNFGGMEHCVMNVNEGEIHDFKMYWFLLIVTNSGQQVVTLGVLLAILMVIFHGLALFRSIRRKRKESKTVPE